MFDLICVRDEIRCNFTGFYQDEGRTIRFVLEDKDHDQREEGYIIDFKIINIDDVTMQVQHMYIDIERYRGIGIPEALILKAKELFGKQIISSTNLHKDNEDISNEGITKQAKKVWERLVNQRFAFYDSVSNRYKTI